MQPWQWKLLFFAVVLGLSGISWAFRKLQEQSKLRQELQDRERRRTEYLRTGKDEPEEQTFGAPVSAPDAQTRLRELAAKRQAQLRALREQQGRGTVTTQTKTGTPSGPVRTELWPGGPVIEVAPKTRPAPTPTARPRPVPVARPTPRPQPQPRLQPQPASRAVQQNSGQQMLEAQRAKQLRDAAKVVKARQVAAQADLKEEERAAMRRRAAAAAAEIGSDDARGDYAISEGPRMLFTPPRTAIEWRAAFIASEVLGPPLGSRDAAHVPGLTT